MKIYKTIDSSGSYSIHYANNEEEAVRKHCIHFSLELDTIIVKVEELNEVDKSKICCDVYCNKKMEVL